MAECGETTENLAQRVLRQRLESLSQAGVLQIGKPSPLEPTLIPSLDHSKTESPETCITEHPLDKPINKEPTMAATGARKRALSLKDRNKALKIIQNEVASCRHCPELADSRTQTVFGVGNPKARLCFFGEAPGADEDRLGEPFVGRAGKLLTKIIEACTLTREDIYILNVLKCRPPGNRNPSTEESQNCRGYFERQLEIIQPEFLCCLGTVAAQALLETTQTIGRLRGQFHEFKGIQVIATYHPAYLLRNPAAKKDVWEDMKMLMKAMGIKIPKQHQD